MIPEVTVHVPVIECSLQGFAGLTKLAAQVEDYEFVHVSLDMSAVNWIDANMCAPLGAVLYRLGRNLNTVRLVNLQPKVEEILSKNEFLSNYGFPGLVDQFGTTMPYKRFETRDERFFNAYIQQHFQIGAIPKMSNELRRKFLANVSEVFSNAVAHSETKYGIFACGQFFPKKNRVNFSVADLGIGIRQNILKWCNLDKPADEAIGWAMEGRNTTRTGRKPGGLGLKLLRDFIVLNQGRMIIVSDQGYWELTQENRVKRQKLAHPFPGTVVNIEINTADQHSYILSSERSLEDIF